MITCLLSTFAEDDLLKSTCDFHPDPVMKGEVVYEVIKVINGIPLFLSEHLQRFQQSLIHTQINGPSEAYIKESLRMLIASNGLKQGNIRFQVSRNAGERSRWYAWVSPHQYPNAEQRSQGVATGVFRAQRPHPEVKRWNEQLKSEVTQYLKSTGYYEVLLTDPQGFITEGSRSNVFFVRNNQLITPMTEQVLHGVTRGAIIQLAIEKGIDFCECPISTKELPQMEAAFLSGTSPGILPIHSIDQLRYRTDNMIVNTLTDAYNQHCSDDLHHFEW